MLKKCWLLNILVAIEIGVEETSKENNNYTHTHI